MLRNKAYLGTLVWNKKRYDMKVKTKDGHGKGYRYVNNDASKIVETPNAHEAIISQKEFDEVQRRLAKNRTNSVVRFKNNIYHLSGVLRCHACGMTYRGKMATTNHRLGTKQAWYHCSSEGQYYYKKCHNKAVSAEAINAQVWEIIDIISQNVHVLEELGDAIKCSIEEPEECYREQLENMEELLGKNLVKQKEFYEVFKEDKINVDIYKEKAEILRNEEKKLRTDIKLAQLKILDKRNSINVMKETQDFLLSLKKNSGEESLDYNIKTFMRIIFKNIYISDQKIVMPKLEINQPWKFCWEEGVKWTKPTKNSQKSFKTAQRLPTDALSYWRPTAVK